MEGPSLAPSPQLQACGKALLFLPAWFSWGLLLPWEMGRFSDGRSLTMISSYPSLGETFMFGGARGGRPGSQNSGTPDAAGCRGPDQELAPKQAQQAQTSS
jgi:hypothetical protein